MISSFDANVQLLLVILSQYIAFDREKEREGERKMGDCETFTNYKIACCVRCLFCLRLVLFSVCLSGVCYSTKEIEIEIEKEREGERERES